MLLIFRKVRVWSPYIQYAELSILSRALVLIELNRALHGSTGRLVRIKIRVGIFSTLID